MRLIDADKLIEDLVKNRNFYPALVASAIKNTPTVDAVEVVRCKDCRRWTPDGSYGLDLDGTKRLYGECYITKYIYREDNFCCFGARKEK